MRYLPPGSMRRQRWLGRLEGSIASLVLVCLLGLGFAAATPAELYRPAPNLSVDLITDYLVSISSHVAHQDDPKAQAEIGELLRMLTAVLEIPV